ncbi:efflux RND transporter permease subunit [Natrinema halophilum]|uniref:Efflux RND transporter permease subunit n=1 Tax=Natrinema halophilum TaxID=1699371 RepID=A0A7D5GF96_9EURY|nr:efflux RND transporter permease subunit [Natrinema halophilum]QLG47468.1 hypothetical protein HYG82_00695 [Natrinema halophilum]
MIAIDNLSDAIDVSREFLTPIDAGKWLRLALIVLFVASFGVGGPAFSGGNAGTGSVTDAPMGQSDAPPTFEEDFPTSELLFWGLVVLAVFVAVWLIYGFLSGVMTFVFLESLRTSEIHIRRYFGDHLQRGLWLFLFRLGLGLLFAILLGAPVLVIVFFAMDGLGALTVGSILAFLPYAIVVGLLYGVTMQFTTAFVAPVMLIEDRGVLAAWRRFWTTARPNWAEYGIYLLLVWILRLVTGAVAWFVIGIAGLVLAIPFAVVIATLVFLLGPIGVILSIPVGLIGVALGLLLVGVVMAPIVTYFQYYALLLLGDTDADLDLIPDQRSAVRTESANWRNRSDDIGSTDRDSDDEQDERIGLNDEIDREDSTGPNGETGEDEEDGW